MDYQRKERKRPDSSDEHPMYSRLFIVCSRQTSEDSLTTAFSKFGTVEDVKMPRDHNSGEVKGIAYVKFSKTSEAADALEAMDGKTLPDCKKPLKVMVAGTRSDINNEDDNAMKHRRVFITIPKSADETVVEEYFSQFGDIQAVLIQRNRDTLESKGFAYVKFYTFSAAARAVESCDKKYRAIFAQPKKPFRNETVFESNLNNIVAKSNYTSSLIHAMNTTPKGYNRIMYMCAPFLNQNLMHMVFDIVPGLVSCVFTVDHHRNCGKGYVTYANPTCAAYAVEKLNMFEYPPGMKVFVKPDKSNFDNNVQDYRQIPDAVDNLRNAISYQTSSGKPDLAKLADAIAEATKLVKMATADGTSTSNVPDKNDLNYCSVNLPEPKPLAHIDSPVAKRCFLVCKPSPPPLTALRDIFCRFGDLINVYTLPNKTVGYARYASVEAADMAIKTLHGAEVCGIRMKVLEAEDEAPNKRRRYDD